MRKTDATLGRMLLAVIVLASFAFGQPLLERIGGHPQFLAAHRFVGGGVVLLAFGITLLPGLTIAAALGALRWVSSRVARVGSILAIGAMAAIVVLPALDRIGTLPSAALYAMAAAVGCVAAWLYSARPAARTFVEFLTPMLLLFPTLFLLRDGVRSLVRPVAVAPIETPSLGADAPPVFILMLDEFPLAALLDEDQHIDAVRFPAFSELAATSHWFRNGTSVHSDTRTAVPAALTGRYPRPREPRRADLADYPRNLFTWMSGAMPVRTIEPVSNLLGPNLRGPTAAPRGSWRARQWSLVSDLGLIYLHSVLPTDTRQRLPTISGAWRDFAARRKASQRDDVEGVIALFEEGAEGGISFAHLILPHWPWSRFPNGRSYTEHFPTFACCPADADPRLPTQLYQRLLLQIGYVDGVVGRIIARLRALDAFDRSLLIVVADHGIALQPGVSARSGSDPYLEADIMPVPLFVKAPGQAEGSIDVRNAEIIDILPTVAHALGVEVPWAIDGASLLAPPTERPTKRSGRKDPEATDPSVFPFVDAAYLPSLERKLAIFGPGHTKPDGLFRFGDHSDLIGRPIADLRSTEDVQFRVAVDLVDRYAALDVDQDPLPALIRGVVDGPRPAPDTWAVAVNGVVQAVVPTHRRLDGSLAISALAPEQAFVDGVNQIDIAWVDGEAGERRLHSVASVDSDTPARERFETLPQTLARLDQTTAFAPFTPFGDLELRSHDAGDGAAFTVNGLRVGLESPDLSTAGSTTLGLAIDLETPEVTWLKVFYRTRDEPRYVIRHMRRRLLEVGRNRIFFTFEDASGIEGFQIHLRPVEGSYRLRGLEVRGLESP